MATCQAEIQMADKMEKNAPAILKPVKQSTLFDAVVQGLGWPGAMITNPKNRPYNPSAALSGLSFLLVEDNPFNRKVAMKLLKTAGIVPDVASCGKEAIKAVRSKQYNAVLMDVQMPEMDGFEVTRIIRSLPGLSDLPIIAITADAGEEEREKGLQCGMSEYITKPIDPEALFKTLESLVPGTPSPLSAQDASPSAGSATTCTKQLSEGRDNPIPGVNWADAMKRFSGNEPLLRSVIGNFAQDLAPMPACLNRAVVQNDFHEARRIVHDIKGAAANISAEGLFSAASRLGKALRDEEPLAVVETLENCLTEIERFLTMTSELTPDASSGPPSAVAAPDLPDREEMAEELRELDLLLSKNSMEARTRAATLEPALCAAGHGALFGKVVNALKRYDFKSAREELGSIMANA